MAFRGVVPDIKVFGLGSGVLDCRVAVNGRLIYTMNRLQIASDDRSLRIRHTILPVLLGIALVGYAMILVGVGVTVFLYFLVDPSYLGWHMALLPSAGMFFVFLGWRRLPSLHRFGVHGNHVFVGSEVLRKRRQVFDLEDARIERRKTKAVGVVEGAIGPGGAVVAEGVLYSLRIEDNIWRIAFVCDDLSETSIEILDRELGRWFPIEHVVDPSYQDVNDG